MMSPDTGIRGARPVEPAEVAWLEDGLRQVGFFSALGRAQLAQVLPYMLMIRYAAGSVVCAEGDAGDALYLIFKGAVAVTKRGWSEPVARLTDGDFFGEMALLFGEPRSATVRTETETEVFCLAAQDFQRVIGRTPDMAEALREMAEARRRELAQS
ncbi:MAG: cyclic nucleotide-binding domain-containing protein [Elusimicrobia bacterium]|nr:cyclic nucleotide-binding domain-containing protein [Elusimicrobiota bacterium]